MKPEAERVTGSRFHVMVPQLNHEIAGGIHAQFQVSKQPERSKLYHCLLLAQNALLTSCRNRSKIDSKFFETDLKTVNSFF